MSRRTMDEARRIWLVVTRVALVLLVTVALTGCGRKGNPQPPPGEQNHYPRTYPSS
ncbi:MAG TPA: lipoprotein [Stellaceae bacterium]|nr:lipoprotein [Stellaceae bacterium]